MSKKGKVLLFSSLMNCVFRIMWWAFFMVSQLSTALGWQFASIPKCAWGIRLWLLSTASERAVVCVCMCVCVCACVCVCGMSDFFLWCPCQQHIQGLWVAAECGSGCCGLGAEAVWLWRMQGGVWVISDQVMYVSVTLTISLLLWLHEVERTSA